MRANVPDAVKTIDPPAASDGFFFMTADACLTARKQLCGVDSATPSEQDEESPGRQPPSER